MRKINLLVFLVSLILFSCTAPPENISATVVPSATTSGSVTMTAPVVAAQTAAPGLIPKHNDLIFVEFFAVT
jgi:starvation-inducible outer membrane lipoprotein